MFFYLIREDGSVMFFKGLLYLELADFDLDVDLCGWCLKWCSDVSSSLKIAELCLEGLNFFRENWKDSWSDEKYGLGDCFMKRDRLAFWEDEYMPYLFLGLLLENLLVLLLCSREVDLCLLILLDSIIDDFAIMLLSYFKTFIPLPFLLNNLCCCYY